VRKADKKEIMAEERKNQPDQEPKRRRRRRPLRNRNKHARKAQSGENSAPQPAPPDSDKTRRERSERRRRRRSKSERQAQSSPSQPQPEAEDLNFQPPASVFIYTHVIRPSTRDSYEFRSDPFSKISRRLEDFHIDLSALFPEEGESREAAAPAVTSTVDFADDSDEYGDEYGNEYGDEFDQDEEDPNDPTATSETE